MNRDSVTHLLLGVALALSLVCCASSPDPIFYSLSSRTNRALSSPQLRIEVRRVGLPGYLDRPHIVRRASDERLELAADDRWGAPLDAMVGSTLTDDLSEQLPNCVVFSEAGSISTVPDVRVQVEITRFELAADGVVQLRATFAVRWGDAADSVRLKHSNFRVRPASKSTADLVSSMSRALAELTDAIAQTILQGAPASETGASKPTAPVAPVAPVAPLVPVAPLPPGSGN